MEKSRDITLLTKVHIVTATINLDSVLKSRDIILLTKGPSSQSFGFSSGHV